MVQKTKFRSKKKNIAARDRQSDLSAASFTPHERLRQATRGHLSRRHVRLYFAPPQHHWAGLTPFAPIAKLEAADCSRSPTPCLHYNPYTGAKETFIELKNFTTVVRFRVSHQCGSPATREYLRDSLRGRALQHCLFTFISLLGFFCMFLFSCALMSSSRWLRSSLFAFA